MSLENLGDTNNHEVEVDHTFVNLEIESLSGVKPAIVIREESTDTTCTLVESNDTVDFISYEENCVTPPAGNKLLNSKLLQNDLHSSNPSLVSDISSECSDLEDIYLEPESEHNKTDIAFAEDTNVPFEIRRTAVPTFEIDLNDREETSSEPGISTSCSNNKNHEDDTNDRAGKLRRNSEMREKLPPAQPKQVSNLSLRHVGMTKSHSSPSLMEIGCFGFRGEDYYRNCAHIVAEARQREKLRDFRGANEMLRAAVEILIAGVQHDPDPMRREGVRRRTAEYLQIAENFATKHRSQQQNRKPIIMSREQVKAFRVLSVKDRVLIVQSPKSGNIHALKTLRKPLSSSISGQSLVVRSPFLVPLIKYCVAEDVVFILLKRVQGQILPDYVNRFKHTTPLPTTLNEVGGRDPNTAPLPPSPLTVQPATQGLVPRNLVRKWAAQIVVCLSSLHKQGLVYADLNPRNIIIDDFSNVAVTYITQLPGLHHRVSPQAVSEMFVAPEVLTGLHAVTPAADWWSFGAILFYLMSGHPLSQYYPYQAIRTTKIKITSEDQSGGSSLVAGLLKYNPAERLGAGVMGSEEIRSHIYFSSIKWESLEKSQALLGGNSESTIAV
ncbi:hypothetical protein ACHWQZ_G003016 [Mnemiopsis leidyi]